MSWVSERLSEIRARLVPTRAWLARRIAQGWHWLIAPGKPLTWAALRAKLTLTTLPLPKTNGGRLAVLVGVGVLILLALLWYASGQPDEKGVVTYPHASLINPILGGLGALFLIYAAIRQARTATEVARTGNRQAEIAGRRHVTDTFSQAVEQLGSDKMEVRVGGIYTLERLAGEALARPQAAGGTAEEGSSQDLYWTVMETLTAFVRERTRPEAERLAKPRDQRASESAYLLWKNAGMPEGRSGEFWSEALEQEALRERPATDIAAVLQVLCRRPEPGRKREKLRNWRLDLRMTDLRGADLSGALLEGARLSGAHLQGAYLGGAHLEGAFLGGAHLDGAFLGGADGVDLSGAIGDAKTRLPARIERPADWPPYAP